MLFRSSLILNKDPQSHILILGGPKDFKTGEEIREGTEQKDQEKIHNLCGKISLDQSLALIAQSQALVSNDSGLMHIGASFQIHHCTRLIQESCPNS